MERCYVYIGDATLNVIESIQIESEKKLEVMDLLAVGAAPVPDNRQPMGYTIKGEITGRPYPYNEDGWMAAREITDTLAAIQDGREPVRLVISRDGAGFSDWVYVRDYRQEEAEVSGDFIITIKCIHHVPYGLRELDVPNLPRPGKVPPKPVIISDGQGNLGDHMKNGDTPKPGEQPLSEVNSTGEFIASKDSFGKVRPLLYPKTIIGQWVAQAAERIHQEQRKKEQAILDSTKSDLDYESLIPKFPDWYKPGGNTP